ncbi:beta-lactamase/transpeptidase-like protein [Sordaria brevicollis]|uniref:Beta-lactamase/transpeptidase-like protein n=1 Tax=Sordaria brevicollis TaxID=83679 RepID=A0AAE0PK84_SORBR|nr:beta-lactamase/transpeptidase-like protein [Sordaria brevicollis]
MRLFSRISGVIGAVFGECMAATNLAVSRVFGFRHESAEVVREEAIGKRDTNRYQPASEVPKHHRQDTISIRTLDSPYSPKVSATSTLIDDTSYLTTLSKQPSPSLSVEEIMTLAKPTIEKLLQDSGSVGASLGVLRHDERHFLNVGARSLDVTACPDHDTVYLISSMTKPIIAAAVGILMDDFPKYHLKFDTPVSTVLPEIQNSPGIQTTYTNQELCIGDLLDLRSSFQWMTNLWESPDGDLPWKTIDPIMSLLLHLPANNKYTSHEAFVHNRNYSNECFALLVAIIERKTGSPWTEFLRQKVLEPLGMHNTLVGLTEAERNNPTFAKPHSVQVTGIMPDLVKCTDAQGQVSRTKIAECFDRHYGTIPQPVEILPSQASSTSYAGPSPLAGAAGIMSTTSDLLMFYSKLIEVYNQRQPEQDSKVFPFPEHLSTPLERGINRLFAHMESRLGPDPTASTCTYSGGWNTVSVPMSPEERNACPRPRWPGADGDNARRLESAIKSKIHGNDLDYSFFLTKSNRHSSDTINDPSQKQKHLALYHGGNMVGATSFCWLLPDHETAVVVLCNTRGFLFDAANLSGMLLAECLYLAESDQDTGSVMERVKQACRDTERMAKAIQIDYLHDLTKYEHALTSRFRKLGPASNGTAAEELEGRYELNKDVFITITTEDRGPILRLYGTGYGYLLRHSHGKNTVTDGLEKTMTFAQPMAELIARGVGGTNRLRIEDFVVVFKRASTDGAWEGFEWNFARDKAQRERRGGTSPYFWRRSNE